MPVVTDGAGKGFSFRSGIKGFPSWGGENRDGNPAAIASNQFQKLENVVHDGVGDLRERPGQAKYGDSHLTKVLGIADVDPRLGDAGGFVFGSDQGSNDPWTKTDCTVVSPPLPPGTMVLAYHGELSSTRNIALYNPDYSSRLKHLTSGYMDHAFVIRHTDGTVYCIGDIPDGTVSYVGIRSLPSGNIILTLAKRAAGDANLLYGFREACSLRNRLYLAYKGNGTTSRVYSYDTVTGELADEDAPGWSVDDGTFSGLGAGSEFQTHVMSVFEHEGRVFAYYRLAGTNGQVRTRSTAGVWATALCNPGGNNYGEPAGFSYFASVVYLGMRRDITGAADRAVVLSFDGTNFATLARNLGVGEVLRLHHYQGGNYLAVCWWDDTTDSIYIARYDGTWTDTYITLTTGVTAATNLHVSMFEYRGELYVFLASATTMIWRIAGGTATAIHTVSGWPTNSICDWGDAAGIFSTSSNSGFFVSSGATYMG
jgi:hypothetical protein